ncbi:MAG: hypothetical protein E6I62_00280 [Chloroflexi bacterium]|nr:MAG: hypothetical protein E6I62_00280 [Chloroflexota bacterium]
MAVAISAVAIDHVARNAQRVESDHDRRMYLDGKLEPDLATTQQVLDLAGLPLRKTNESRAPVTLQAAHAIWIVDPETPADLGNRDVWPGGDESTKTGGAGALG